MIGASEIAEVLGGKEILGREIRANYDLMALIEEGIPKKSLRVILVPWMSRKMSCCRYLICIVVPIPVPDALRLVR